MGGAGGEGSISATQKYISISLFQAGMGQQLRDGSWLSDHLHGAGGVWLVGHALHKQEGVQEGVEREAD